jgi:hypothetical protein
MSIPPVRCWQGDGVKALRRYIAAHHEEWGVALFVLPPLLLVTLVWLVWEIVAWAMP